MYKCPICNRESDDTMTEHHLIPKSKKGSETVTLHGVCHSKIHSIFTNVELANWYHSVHLIMEHEAMQKFAKYMRNKPRNYKDSNRMTNKRNPNKRK